MATVHGNEHWAMRLSGCVVFGNSVVANFNKYKNNTSNVKTHQQFSAVVPKEAYARGQVERDFNKKHKQTQRGVSY
jgi:hypothetical protein